MKEYENKYGFTVSSVERVDEVDATLVDMMHVKSGARLIFLDRHDENTTFCIAFKTPPTDDTGVFHILEHSVLAGSRKFPTKDPFNEMVKGSLATYLNALTSGDKTLYPVSSKNAKSFRGLVDVYLDAVFHPLAVESPFVFMQEGHRYELDEDGDLSITGVVYNEMQGVYTTAEDYADYLISRQLQPGGTYAYDSGGHPDFIPELTFEDFKRTHATYYHPSNSVIFLDGDVVLDEILPLIDSYLSEYDKREVNFVIDDGAPTVTDIVTDTYPIEEGDDPTDKTRIFLSYNSFDYSDIRNSVLSVITEAVADISSAPLTKRILDTGLCESFNFYNTRTYKTNALHVTFTGVKDGKEMELLEKYEAALTDMLSEGVAPETLGAFLKRREFKVRESDSGTYPKGMVYMRACIDSAILGENVADSLRYEDVFAFLYEKIGTDYYLDVLREVISSDRATLILHPDPDFNAKKEEKLYEKLDAIAATMTEEDKARLIAENEAFKRWQSTPDDPEKLATLPTLSLSDIDPEPKRIPTEVIDCDGTPIVLHPLYTGGISYADLYFDVTDADEEEIHYLRLLCDMNYEWDTEKSTSQEFRSKSKFHLGSFFLTITPIKRKNEAKLYLFMHLSCLDSEKDNAIDILTEYLTCMRYENANALKKNVKQFATASTDSICMSGSAMASVRNAARYNSYEAMTELVLGYENHRFIKSLAEKIDESADEVLRRFDQMHKKYFRRERLTVGITEPDGIEYARRLVATVPAGAERAGATPVKPIEMMNEAIAIPGNVSFTALGSNLSTVGENLYGGSFYVYQAIASYELLWNEIRIKNGAYGTDCYISPTGTLGCTSYRDPLPAASIAYFTRLPEEIADFLNTSPDLQKYIIGVFGEMDTVSTPRSDGNLATKRYLTGLKHEEVIRRRRECLDTSIDDLRRINGYMKEAIKHSTFTAVGSRDTLERIKGIGRILEI